MTLGSGAVELYLVQSACCCSRAPNARVLLFTYAISCRRCVPSAGDGADAGVLQPRRHREGLEVRAESRDWECDVQLGLTPNSPSCASKSFACDHHTSCALGRFICRV